MAMLSTREALVACLGAKPASSFPHVWLSGSGGLVAGVYPKASVRFDFGSEAFVDCKDTAVSHEPNANTPVDTSASDTGAVSGKRRISLIHEAPRWTQTIEIETPDCVYVVGSATRALITGLELLEELVPGTLEKLSIQKSRSKRPVSRTRNELFDLATQLKYSHQLKNGYWVGTNNKSEEALNYVRRAVELAGLNGKITIRPARPR